jgi:hypothetical protein
MLPSPRPCLKWRCIEAKGKITGTLSSAAWRTTSAIERNETSLNIKENVELLLKDIH